ncbi:MAG: sulfatase [Phycisphaeraceae bacterium]
MVNGNDQRPNILFIMDDQHRFDWLGCAGADWVNTPNIDRLAARGMRFTNCYTNAPVCAPARIALATGKQITRVGALSNGAYLPLSAPTYYQRLRDHGYYVGCVGKLDLAKPDRYNGIRGDRPITYAWGFTHPIECEGKMHAGGYSEPIGPYTAHLHERGLLQKFHEDYKQRSMTGWAIDTRDSVLPTEDFEDAYIGRRAAEWIADIPDDFPFHLFVSFVGPHDPFDPPTEYAERYRGADMPEPIPPAGEDKPESIRRKAEALEHAGRTPEQIAEARRQYSAAVEQIDDEVGRMIGALEQRGMLENTYIIFSSDHGEMLGDHGLYTKSVPFEAAAHVPLIIAGPGIPAGRTSDAMVELIDLNPTICDLAGVEPAPSLDARSLAPVLREEANEHRSEVLSMLMGFQFVCDGRHKLIQYVNAGNALYDIEQDPAEQRNVVDEHPDVARRLGQRLNQRLREGAWHH